ncbi:MAG: CsbD family protein [Roseobacter sp.]
MNWDIIDGNWTEFTGAMKSKWGELTDDDIAEAKGDRDRFIGKLQQRYGILKDDAERQLDAFIAEQKNAA